ncbi:hypothetical protein EV421DRAFT_2023106 [Armillaria borealis]|uniref:Uncharacterized protein n=1 Tax=Armillaria borealis TaxID=47425 RepID=A0AA39J144_9AGAR|nr:hypothetical protein EV421DRAFT_2023106 [Armillaria borealis]
MCITQTMKIVGTLDEAEHAAKYHQYELYILQRCHNKECVVNDRARGINQVRQCGTYRHTRNAWTKSDVATKKQQAEREQRNASIETKSSQHAIKTAQRQERISPLSQERKRQETTPSQHTIIKQCGGRSNPRHHHRNRSNEKPNRRNTPLETAWQQEWTSPITGTQAAKKTLRHSTPLENGAAAGTNLLATTKTKAARNQTVATRYQKQRGSRSGPRHCHRNASDYKIPLRRSTPLENGAAVMEPSSMQREQPMPMVVQ